jgi:bifunctional non-homologous end joining protein LigD
MIIMDFDPAEDVPFSKVKEGAVEMREMLKQLGLRSFLKTTGGKGLHVVFPFEPNYDWETVKNFAHTLTQEFVSRHPDLYTGNMSKKTRKGKIFLDYLRNGRGATAVAPYSLRARERSSVAMPIEWSELDKLKASNIFTLPKALAWLGKRKKDPWKDFFRTKQSISILN